MGDAHLPGRAGTGDLRNAVQRRLRFAQEQVDRDFQALEQPRDESALLRQQCGKEVLDFDRLVAKPRGFLLRRCDGGRGLLGKFI